MTDEPIIVMGSRWKAGLLAFGAAAAVAGGFWMLSDPGASRDTAWFCIVFFGFCSLIGVAQILWPAVLTLGPTGFVLHALWIRRSVRWDQVSNFRVWSPRPPARVVAYDFVPDRPGLDSLSRLRVLSGVWSTSPADLVALLAECKARWGRR
jgi:hypothetical protein